MKNQNKYTFTYTYDELFKLLKHVFQEGYAMGDIVEAGLESYDPDTMVRWILLKELKIKKNKMNNERIIKALLAKAISEKEEAMMALHLFTNYAVGIGDHTANDIMKDADIALQKLVDAEDKIETLNRLYPDIKL